MTEGKSIINANLTPLPDKVGVDGLEDKWRTVWDEDGTYKFRNTRDRKAVYSIDTPPPTVSGSLHVGVLLHAHRCDCALQAHARLRRVLPDGLG